MTLEKRLKPYLEMVNDEIVKIETFQKVPLFYDPIYYVLDLPGKKIRPLMVLLSCGMAGGNLKDARFAAAAVELLHNFTLVHDDIMDNDETRRGKPTVHVKWDLNSAILSGDGLLGFAFQKLLQTPVADRAVLADRFTKAMIVICEGQGLDKMFEDDLSITADMYLDMIHRKTAALISMSCEIGGLIAGASEEEIQLLFDYGHNLGMGFQVHDDILDVVADQSKLGKKVGSDFEMHKQTVLSIKLRQKIGHKAFEALDLDGYTQTLKSEGVYDAVADLADNYFEKARNCLDAFPNTEHKEAMLAFADEIQKRSY